MTFKKTIKVAIARSLYPICRKTCEYVRFVPPGHYYSPIPSADDLKSSQAPSTDFPYDIEPREDEQLSFLSDIAKHYREIPGFTYTKSDNYRFRYDNHYYSYPDTTIFACIMRHVKPKRIVDVGGGISTALMLDLNEAFFPENPAEIEVIEPYPASLKQNIRPDDKLVLHHKKVQDVPLSVFEALEENDILFLDTTHVSKRGSDINFIAFEVLPRLAPGVLVHIHEMFFPLEYPESFFHDGKHWNEIYFWRAFLMGNREFEIVLYNSFLEKMHKPTLKELFPRYFDKGNPDILVQNCGASLWLRKT